MITLKLASWTSRAIPQLLCLAPSEDQTPLSPTPLELLAPTAMPDANMDFLFGCSTSQPAAHSTVRTCFKHTSRPVCPSLFRYQHHCLSQAWWPQAAVRCSLPWTVSLSCPEGLLPPDHCCRLLLKSPPTPYCSVCHDMALLGANSSRKHPAGCWALDVDEHEDEGKGQGKGNRTDRR